MASLLRLWRNRNWLALRRQPWSIPATRGRFAPVELPDMELPAASAFLTSECILQEAWNAYEEIRTVENVKLGAVPPVSTASNLWKELRGANCNDPAFHTLLMRLESSTLFYRSALQALAQANQRNGEGHEPGAAKELASRRSDPLNSRPLAPIA